MTTGDDDGSCPRRAGSSPTSTAAQDRADNGKPAHRSWSRYVPETLASNDLDL